MANKLFIHIGYPKTGTTMLQEHLFTQHRDVFYLNPYLTGDVFQAIYYGRETFVKRNKEYFKNFLEDIQIPKNKAVVISAEGITGLGMIFGRVNERLSNNKIITIDPTSIARKLYEIFSNIDVFDEVFVFGSIRRQQDLLRSMYAQEYDRLFSMDRDTNTFEKFLKFSITNKYNFILEALQYSDTFSIYEELFGSEKIKVFVFEEMKLHPQGFYNEISSYLDIDPIQTIELCHNKKSNVKNINGKYLSDGIKLVQLLGKFKQKIIGNRALGLTSTKLYQEINSIRLGRKVVKNDIPDKDMKKLNEIFCEGNVSLNERFALQLQRWDYFMS